MGGGGRAWGGDLTFFKNLPSNSLPTGKSFQSNATKFPHPGLHIAIKYPKAEPKKGTMKISPNKTLQSLLSYFEKIVHMSVVSAYVSLWLCILCIDSSQFFRLLLRLQVFGRITLNIFMIQTLCTVVQLFKGSYFSMDAASRHF